MMAPRQCQIHYRLSLFISTLEEKPLPCPFFLSIGPRGFSLLCSLNFLHIYREGTLQFALLYIVTLCE
jgi:hypothetical protein